MAEHSVNDTQQAGAGSLPGLDGAEGEKAAALIQRTFRGHRARRQLKGFGLDAETRWHEAIRDAQYQQLTSPAPPRQPEAKSRWNHAVGVAQRAGADDASLSGYSSDGEGEDPDRRPDAAQQKKTAKMMDLQYFLEMVDQKHRYGSNLRKYHAHWQAQDTRESFFYWLDQGQGKTVGLPECSRSRLEAMQVRYLSRDERQNYLVQVDAAGLLVWAKNGERVWTKDELYKDSIKGIVPTTDPTPKFTHNVKSDDLSSSENEDSEVDEPTGDSTAEDDTVKHDTVKHDSVKEDNTLGDEGEQYVNEDFHRARGPAKLKHVSAAVLFNHMVRNSLKKGHKWIFVADTSFRLYIGYKQSGAFQHSSFLHGSRIAAAGLIKVKDGRLKSLSPLSGHYRPPVANFRSFVHALKEQGVDMSRVSISKSYAVLVGMEGYTRGQKQVKAAEKAVAHGVDKVVHPEKDEDGQSQKHDKSTSAEADDAQDPRQSNGNTDVTRRANKWSTRNICSRTFCCLR